MVSLLWKLLWCTIVLPELSSSFSEIGHHGRYDLTTTRSFLSPTDNPEEELASADFETGLEHLLNHVDYPLNLELIPYLVDDVRGSGYNFTNKSSISQLVQRFIRHTKGLSVVDEPSSDLLVSGPPGKPKVEWCFFPYFLKYLVQIEVKFYDILSKFYLDHVFEHDLFALDSYLEDIRGSTLKAIQNQNLMENYAHFDGNLDPHLFVASHPLLIYRIVRRFAVDLQPILRQLDSIDGEIISKLSDTNPQKIVFPVWSDVVSAWQSIERIQLQTRVPTADLVKGQLEHVNTGIHMTALHALELGTYYYKEGVFDLSIEWLHFALETVKKRALPERHLLIEQFIERVLLLAVEEHNENFKAQFDGKWDSNVFNATVSLPFSPKLYQRRVLLFDEEATNERQETVRNWAIKTNFHRTCAGETLLTEQEKAALVCYYGHSRHWYWYINPLKIELLYWDPPVFLIHEMLSDTLINQLKVHAIPRLARSKVIDRATGGSKYEGYRTSSQVWMYETRQQYLEPLTRKLEMLSLLTIRPYLAHDAYQVACYGPSHHYEAHLDAFENFRIVSPDKGNRIVTFMAYLADVSVGGRTAFPVLGIYTQPVKGSVVMWYNLKRNGEFRDERMWHGGCPVILGLKWITTKWVYYYENVKQFRCALDPHA